MFDMSKWYSLKIMLEIMPKLIMHQPLYEKVCAFVLKIWTNCPTLLLQKIIDCAIHLIVVNKRSLEFLITIREKILNSKFWSHRKSYILFYSSLKAEASFDVHKMVPILPYKLMAVDKSFGVRLTLAEYLPKI